MHHDGGVPHRCRAQLVKKRADALADGRKRLSAVGRVQRGGGERSFAQLRAGRDDLVPPQTFPLAEIELAQPRIAPDFEPVRLREDRSGLDRANEIARVNDVEAFAAQTVGKPARLRAPYFGEWNVGMPLEAV